LAGEGIRPEPAQNHPQNLRLGLQEYEPLKSRHGGYVAEDTEGYQCLLDFQGPTSYRTFALSDAVDGKVPKEALRDRVVLVGVALESVIDEHRSPLPQRMRGVEMHAQFIDQIIRRARTDQPSMRFVPEWIEMLLVAMATLLGAIGIWRGRSVWSLLLVLGASGR
jgi:CHASE2 domain-containing sensor protein